MTWAIKIRGDAKSLIAAEYECPVHGRFEITAPRDEVLDEEVCGFRTGIFCGRIAPFCFPSPARARVQRVTAARRGKDPERPPGVMDWQAMAYEEKSPEEWLAAERKQDFEDVRKIVKGALR